MTTTETMSEPTTDRGPGSGPRDPEIAAFRPAGFVDEVVFADVAFGLKRRLQESRGISKVLKEAVEILLEPLRGISDETLIEMMETNGSVMTEQKAEVLLIVRGALLQARKGGVL
jgi:hypothetical protein